MNAQYFIYTRNMYNDYKLVYSPGDDFCTTETRKLFLKQARSVINIETFTPTFDQPRWLYSKKGNLVLFGLGVMNSVLNKDFSTDYTGTPIRGFFGFVVEKASLDILPFDIAFFQSLYSTCMVPIWNCESEDFKKKGIHVDIDIMPYNSINLIGDNIDLNTDVKKSIIWGDKNEELLFRSAMSISEDVSVVTNLIDKAHAFDRDSAFMNSVVIGITSKEERIYKTDDKPTDNPQDEFGNNYEDYKYPGSKKKNVIINNESDLSCIDRLIDRIISLCKKCNISLELLIERINKKMDASRNNKGTTCHEDSSADCNRVNDIFQDKRENVVNRKLHSDGLKKEEEINKNNSFEKFKSKDFDAEISKGGEMSVPKDKQFIDENPIKNNDLSEEGDSK